MTSKRNFKKKLCTLALIASFVLSIGTPAMATRSDRVKVSDEKTAADLGLDSGTCTAPEFVVTTLGVYGGGVVYIVKDTVGSITGVIGANFINNTVSSVSKKVAGGAINNWGKIIDGIKGGSFKNNKTVSTEGLGAGGGAISNSITGTIQVIRDVTFENNTATGLDNGQGGAIENDGEIIDGITGGIFKDNKAVATGDASGGAILNVTFSSPGTIKVIRNVTFENNASTAKASAEGGAIYNWGTITDGIIDSSFTGNFAEATSATGTAQGGAIYNYESFTIKVISGVTFENNYAEGKTKAEGGAIYNGGTITNGITDSSFTDNYAKATGDNGKALGGAIYTTKALLIKAENKDVTFRGNDVSANDMVNNAKGSAIYVDGAVTLTLEAGQGRTITFEDDQTIEGDSTNKYNVAVKGGGTVEFLQEKATSIYPKESGIYGADEVTVGDGSADIPTLVISNLDAQTLTFNNGNIDFTRDAKAKSYNFSAVTLTGNGNLNLDVDLAVKEMDAINVSSGISGSGKLHITALTLLTDSALYETLVPFTNNTNLASATQYVGAEELASHANKYKVRYDSSTGKFIFTKSGVSDTTIATGDTANVMNFVWLETVNNLQKRLGDLRGGEQSDMAWARFQRSNDDYDGARKFNVSGNLYQVGYDFSLKNQVASRGYFGVSLEAFDGTQSYQIGGGDVKSMSLGAYYTKIYDSGHYFDFILRYGRQESDSTSYDATAGLSGILTKLDYAMNSVTLSGEYGYRWNMGKSGLYLEPQAEFIYGYLSGAQATSSTNILADIDSTNHFVTRLGLAFGQRVKNFNYYLRGSYYHDFAGTIHVKYGTTPYQQDSAQNWWEVSLGGGWNISRVSYFYAELTKHFKDVSNSLNFNVGFRFTL